MEIDLDVGEEGGNDDNKGSARSLIRNEKNGKRTSEALGGGGMEATLSAIGGQSSKG